MPLRSPTQGTLWAAACASLIVPGASAMAQSGKGAWRNGSWYAEGEAPPAPPPPVVADDRAGPPPPHHPHPPRPMADHHADYVAPRADPAREAWLADCRSRVSGRDRGVGGAVLGGVIGGVAGNRIAGRGNRTVGTVAGAAVGAAAGVAIDRAEDRGRVRDECEAYLDDYYARYAAGPAYQGGYAYAPSYGAPTYAYAPGYGYPASGCCMAAPVMMVPVQTEPECTETVEYIYEDVPVRRKTYRPARTKIVRDKRVKVVGDKRISSK